jgi:hypothetical protein
MPVKTTGAEFKRFYSDPEWWPKSRWHEGEDVLLNDQPVDEFQVNLSDVNDADKLAISGGWVSDNDGGDYGSFENYFRKWRKKQTSVVIQVEVPKEKAESFKSAIRAAGGKVI